MDKKKFIAAVAAAAAAICIAGVIAKKCKDKCICDSCSEAEGLFTEDAMETNAGEPAKEEPSGEEPKTE